MRTALNSPFKGYYPNVNPFGIAPRYDGNTPLANLYSRYKMDNGVNDKISKVNKRNDANAEIEQGEIVRQNLPNGGTILHKALGKKHKNGGIPVNLPDNSFIFSNYKSTSLDKDELDTYNLGGYSKNINSRTPSKILEKNVDIKNYNKMEKYLQESKDPVEITTAQRMKAKYDEIIAKIAALQEYKKPNTTIPDFAYLLEETPELKDEKTQTEMYKEGGMFLPKYQEGKIKTPYNVKPEGYGSLDKMNEYIKAYNQSAGTNFNSIADVQKHRTETNPELVLDAYRNQDLNPTNKHAKILGTRNIDFSQIEDSKILEGDYDKLWGNRQVLPITKKFKNEQEWFQYLKMRPTIMSNNKPYVYEGNNVYVAPEYEQEVGQPVEPTKPGEPVKPTVPTKGENNLDSKYGDNMSWLKGYNWTPKMLSMLGNMAQYPRAYNPSLSLSQPVRFREQLLDAQPGVNDLLANRYMSLKAANQYAPQSLATRQFVDSDINKQINDYRYKVDQANQGVSTNVNNQNAQLQNQVVNSNNDRRAQYIDKMNELYQNMANERNTINATNLNLLGQGLNEQDQTNLSNDLMRRQYAWNVNQLKQSMNTPEQMQAEIERINKLPMEDYMKKIYLTGLVKKYYGTNQAVNPYSNLIN